MDRSDWLLIMLAFKGQGGAAMDPVRVQKGMFLFAHEADVDSAQKYAFEPYNYGPYSSELRSDLSRLSFEGLIEAEPVEGYTWSRYSVTEDGKQRASGLLSEGSSISVDAAKQLFEIKQGVTSLSFTELLEDVYERYPAYAEKSVFRR